MFSVPPHSAAYQTSARPSSLPPLFLTSILSPRSASVCHLPTLFQGVLHSSLINPLLVLFLFLVGLEVDLNVIRQNYKAAVTISAAGMILPFGIGAAVAVPIFNQFIDTQAVEFGHFLLFVGVAMSITAFRESSSSSFDSQILLF